MNKLIFVFLSFFLFSSCSQYKPTLSVEQVVNLTMEARATQQISPTATRQPTRVPTLPPSFDNNPKSINGSILSSNKLFLFPSIAFTSIEFTKDEGYSSASDGKEFLIINLYMQNIGDSIAEYGDIGFKYISENGTINDPTYIDTSCVLPGYIEVLPQGKVIGCVVFEVDKQDKYSIIYAPYNQDQYGKDRYLQWDIIRYP
jgi:hypothetical protein